MLYLFDVGMNNQKKMIEFVFLTNSSVNCFSCARSSSERQLAVIGDKTKTETVTCKKRTKADFAGMRAIIFFIYDCIKAL